MLRRVGPGERADGHEHAGDEADDGEKMQKGRQPRPRRRAPDRPQDHQRQQRPEIDHGLVGPDGEAADHRQDQAIDHGEPLGRRQPHRHQDGDGVGGVVFADDEEGRRHEHHGDGGDHDRRAARRRPSRAPAPGGRARSAGANRPSDSRRASRCRSVTPRKTAVMIGDLADDHGVEARRVEIEEPLAPGDLDEERRAVDEEAAALPAMPECQPPDQTDRRSVCNRCRWHAQACGLYRSAGADASACRLAASNRRC